MRRPRTNLSHGGGLSRRGVLGLGMAAGLLPLLGARSVNAAQRKFLFIFCPGGWDQLVVFCPIFGDNTDRWAEAEAAEVGGIPFVDSESRPHVRSFLETWASSTLFVNGIQVPSVSHDVCRRIVMTGSQLVGEDDWCSLIGSRAQNGPPMPAIHIEGPIYPVTTVSSVVRVGSAGQLPALLDGTALSAWSTNPYDLPGKTIEDLEDAFLAERLDVVAGGAPRGRLRRYLEAEQAALERITRVEGMADQLQVGEASTLADTAAIVADCLEQGISRSGMVAMEGVVAGWDTHGSNMFQDESFNTLFKNLDLILTDLASRPGESGGTLLDETTVVVLSEMGRVPRLNTAGGKDHWTWTSAMLLGSGVSGGRTVGEWNDTIEGKPVDLSTGEASDSGVTLTGAHLGATLLALADVDPGEYIDPEIAAPIEGAMS